MEQATALGANGNSPNLELLLQRYQDGESAAAAALVQAVSPRVFQFLLAQVRDRPIAEDLLQDFWLRVHKARHTYRPSEPVWPWFFAIARRVQVDGYRRRSRIARHELQTVAIPEVPASTQVTDALDDTLLEVLKTLPANQREAVLLLKVSGFTLEETARVTGISVGAVKQRAHRAFETLRVLLGKDPK